jgi:hypothetical protein
MDIYPDENGLMEWEDEDHTPRTEQELLDFARSELLECLFNGLKYDDISDMVVMEVVEDDR